VAALRALKVPNVRWPGGCFADEYHWRDGIGPADQRRRRVNANWGGAIEPNTFGTHEYFDFLEQIGSEAYVSINVGSGTVQEAADWLEYMTADTRTSLGRERAANGHPQPFKVRFLGIGNESWGCGGSMTPEHYVEELKIFSRYPRNYNLAQADTEPMQRIAVGADDSKNEYIEAVMKAWHERVWSWDIQGVSLHSYTVDHFPAQHPSVQFGTTEYARMLKLTLRMDDLIAQDAAIMDRYDPAKKLALAIDEWGIWLAPLAGTNPGFLVQQNSLRDALLASLNLNIFVRHAERVRMANIAQMANVLQAMIMTDEGRMVLTPTYHVFRMYVPFQDATSIPVRIDAGTYVEGAVSLPRLDAIAAVDAAGVTWLALTNLDPDHSAQIAVMITGLSARSAGAETLTAAHVDAVNSFAAPSTVAPRTLRVEVRGGSVALELPPKSVSVVQIRGENR
jgi:alpha-L-arabinofuranosidase